MEKAGAWLLVGLVALVGFALYSVWLQRSTSGAFSQTLPKYDENLALARESVELSRQAVELQREAIALQREANKLLVVLSKGTI